MRRSAIALAVAPLAVIAACDTFGASDGAPPFEPIADGGDAPDRYERDDKDGGTPFDAGITPLDGGTGLKPEQCGIEKCPSVPSELDNCKEERCSDLDDFDQVGTGIKSENGACRISGTDTYLQRVRDRVQGLDRLYELAFDLLQLPDTTTAVIARISVGTDAVTVFADKGKLYLCEQREGQERRCTVGMPTPTQQRIHVYGTVNGDANHLPRFGLAVGQCDERLALELDAPLPNGTTVTGAVGCVATIVSSPCNILVDNLVVLMRK
jgi:hypothetical protein